MLIKWNCVFEQRLRHRLNESISNDTQFMLCQSIFFVFFSSLQFSLPQFLHFSKCFRRHFFVETLKINRHSKLFCLSRMEFWITAFVNGDKLGRNQSIHCMHSAFPREREKKANESTAKNLNAVSASSSVNLLALSFRSIEWNCRFVSTSSFLFICFACRECAHTRARP